MPGRIFSKVTALTTMLCMASGQDFTGLSQDKQNAWLLNDATISASDGAVGDFFGAYISADVNYTLISATEPAGDGNGKAYVFKRERVNETESGPDDTWNETAILTASDGANGDEFGAATVILEDIAVIGAPFHDIAANADAGAVYLFRKQNDSETWDELQKIEPPTPVDGGIFGGSVGYDGDFLVIGSPKDSQAGNEAGAAYVYEYNNDTDLFEQTATLLHPSPANGQEFGASVSARNGTIAVGVPFENAGAGGNSGSVQIFRYNATLDEWVWEAALLPKNLAGGDNFGTNVFIDYTRVVGSSLLYNGVAGNTGGAWAFDYNTTTEVWNETGEFSPTDLGGNDQFGFSMVVQANFLAIGTPNTEGTIGADSGAVYAYFFNGTSEEWEPLVKLVPDAIETSDQFGYSVALYCESLFVGAPGDKDDAGVVDEGVVYWYNQNFTDPAASCVEKPPKIRECGRFRGRFCDEYECARWQLLCRLRTKFKDPIEPATTCPDVFNPCVTADTSEEEEEEDCGLFGKQCE